MHQFFTFIKTKRRIILYNRAVGTIHKNTLYKCDCILSFGKIQCSIFKKIEPITEPVAVCAATFINLAKK